MLRWLLITLIPLLLASPGCTMVSKHKDAATPEVTPIKLPVGFFAQKGSAIAYMVEGRQPSRYIQVHFPLGTLGGKDRRQDFLLLAHSNRRYWPIPYIRDGNALVAQVTSGLIYVIAERPTDRLGTALDVICRLKRTDRPERQKLLPKICTQILCAPEMIDEATLLEQFGDWGLEPGVAPGGLGGWKTPPTDLCNSCMQIGPAPEDFSLPTLECVTRAGTDSCTEGSLLFADNFEGDSIGVPPAASPSGPPADDSVVRSGSVMVASVAAFGNKAVRVTRSVIDTTLDAVLGAGAGETGSYCVSFRGLTEEGDTPVSVSLLSSGDRAAWRLYIGATGSTLLSGGSPTVLPVNLATGPPHRLRSEVDLGTGRFNLAIDGETVAAGLPFFDLDFGAPAQLRVEYTPMILEGFPGSYVLDDIQVRKTH